METYGRQRSVLLIPTLMLIIAIASLTLLIIFGIISDLHSADELYLLDPYSICFLALQSIASIGKICMSILLLKQSSLFSRNGLILLSCYEFLAITIFFLVISFLNVPNAIYSSEGWRSSVDWQWLIYGIPVYFTLYVIPSLVLLHRSITSTLDHHTIY